MVVMSCVMMKVGDAVRVAVPLSTGSSVGSGNGVSVVGDVVDGGFVSLSGSSVGRVSTSCH